MNTITRYVMVLLLFMLNINTANAENRFFFHHNPPIEFPRDEAAHDGIAEWWYWTGNVQDDEGNTYGFQLTFFNMASFFGFSTLSTHVAITDLSTGRHHHSENFQFFHRPNKRRLNIASRIGSAERFPDGRYEISGDAEGIEYRFTLNDIKGAILHDDDGIVSIGAHAGTGYYYSRPRMDVQGTIKKGGVTANVNGSTWMDHVWGHFVPIFIKGWDWFSIQLDDNSEIMFWIFRRDEENPYDIELAYGTYIDSDGNASKLSQEQVDVNVLDWWQGQETNGLYPQNWTMSIPHLGFSANINATLPEQEMPNALWNYWEGLISIDGTKAGNEINGKGYVELSGYSGGWFQ
ncbi:hypothetical protein CS022_13040 [Veronia nyctiphanis]|uniref:AttH domain-containing protein n=1 Tax=Veronia nyctiphanis TaxID=1278244 RepID=A0A4Q0YPC9_9GAMM|nr:lipocalin family protein [Veronia nyctiphanis]RXJ72786.1 hypothetical protein CS022_13040 [Veronia nyctiphanis]